MPAPRADERVAVEVGIQEILRCNWSLPSPFWCGDDVGGNRHARSVAPQVFDNVQAFLNGGAKMTKPLNLLAIEYIVWGYFDPKHLVHHFSLVSL